MDPSLTLDCRRLSWTSLGQAGLVVASRGLGVGSHHALLVDLVDAANVGHDVGEPGRPNAGRGLADVRH